MNKAGRNKWNNERGRKKIGNKRKRRRKKKKNTGRELEKETVERIRQGGRRGNDSRKKEAVKEPK